MQIAGLRIELLMKRIVFLIGFCFCTLALMAQGSVHEPNLKAAFIYNFTKYIEWDTSDVHNDFVVGILGSSPVSGYLTEIAKTKSAKNKRIIIHHYNKPDEIGPCHILFISANTTFSLSSILEHAGKGVLTISEQPGYASQGTALNFVIVNDKLKFEANLKAIYSAGLNASSQLLKLAIIIN